jgi:hypothetical protein
LHTWSLAVEEQFYIAFPLVLYGLHRWLKRYQLVVILAATTLSFAICLWGTFHKPGATFYLAPFRAWELLMGALVALVSHKVRASRLLMEVLAFSGLTLILASFFLVDSQMPFPGIGAVPAVAGSAAVLLAGTSLPTHATRLLSFRAVVALGLISYPLYLWHWPVLLLARQVAGSALDSARLGLVIAVCVALSGLTYWLVESPIRRRLILSTRARLFAAAAAACASIAAFSVSMIIRDGFFWPVSVEIRDLITANQRATSEWSYPASCQQNFRRSIEDPKDIASCTIGANAERKILFWGDSLVEQLFPVVAHAYSLGHFSDHQIIFATSGGCQPTPSLERLDWGFHCNQFNRHVANRALMSDVDTIVLGGDWSLDPRYLKPVFDESSNSRGLDADTLTEHAQRHLLSTIRQLTAARKKVALILPFPIFPQPIPAYLSRRLLAGETDDVLLTRASVVSRNVSVNAMLHRVAAETGAMLIDPSELLCPSGPCIYQEQMLSLYRDASHLTPYGSRKLLQPMIEAIDRLLPGRCGVGDCAYRMIATGRTD